MSRIEIRLSGFGGQGIILAARILGEGAALFDHKHATMTQNYGPESRGGACSGQVVISDAPVSYPHLTHPNTVVAMSQEAYTKYTSDLVEGGLLLIDEDFVQAESVDTSRVRLYRVPATRIAEKQLGRKMVANIVMLGSLAALDPSVSRQALRESVKVNVPKGTEELNLQAFEKGYEYAKTLVANGASRPEGGQGS